MATSRSAADRAGERIRASIRAGEDPTAEDLAVLDDFRAQFGPLVAIAHEWAQAMADAVRQSDGWEQLRAELDKSSWGVERFLDVASRPKTSDAIVAKLGREQTRLSQMQDIAGARVILPDRSLQEVVRDAVVESFTEHGEEVVRVARVTDTRAHGDEHGYRAIHVVIHIEGRPVEIQIRSALQQIWAQLVESLDQANGWDLKHGEGPANVAAWLKETSLLIALFETDQLAPEDFEIPSMPETFD